MNGVGSRLLMLTHALRFLTRCVMIAHLEFTMISLRVTIVIYLTSIAQLHMQMSEVLIKVIMC